ncbi:hypothetical protein [Haliangium sp. UPWRP_2]|uniref:plasmid mobilization protein n=1 Tax=Haliangium sp. UPWRP_2 TaxID=1931276 RepID=UPI000B5448A1|nr:hypothetical protein [Haliangium sp. UPWRP_2]PSM31673.1 hypothetical protein BVG81_004195 [Haliangium sp. UPWRP_2]
MPKLKKAPEKTKDEPRMGRPPVSDEARRASLIKVLTTEAERAELEQAASAAGIGISTWVRVAALEKARRGSSS